MRLKSFWRTVRAIFDSNLTNIVTAVFVKIKHIYFLCKARVDFFILKNPSYPIMNGSVDMFVGNMVEIDLSSCSPMLHTEIQKLIYKIPFLSSGDPTMYTSTIILKTILFFTITILSLHSFTREGKN